MDNLRRRIYVHTFWITILYQVMPVEEDLKRKGRFINHGVECDFFYKMCVEDYFLSYFDFRMCLCVCSISIHIHMVYRVDHTLSIMTRSYFCVYNILFALSLD